MPLDLPDDDAPRPSDAAFVDRWVQRWAPGRDGARLVDAFEVGWEALWQEAYVILGPVTLAAIARRVLVHSCEGFAVLHPLTVDHDGLSFKPLREQAERLDPGELTPALRCLLAELLKVLGTLTGGLLTERLRGALERARPPAGDDDGGGEPRGPADRSASGEERPR